jgi:hypothetical protein
MTMELSEKDHIDVGAGWLYGPPFVATYLLYRLFDCNSSVLIHHRPEACVPAADSFPNVSFGDLTLTTNVASAEGPPTAVYIHCDVACASTRVEDLLNLPADRLVLSMEVPTIAAFDDVVVRVERFPLHFTERLMIAGELAPLCDFWVAKSDYRVVGRIGVSFWPVGARPKKLRVWKVSVENAQSNAIYNVQSACAWSLTAFHFEEGPESTIAVTLDKAACSR